MQVLFIGPLPEPITGQSLACQVLLERLRAADDIEVDVINLSKVGFRQGVDSMTRLRQVALYFAQTAWRHRRADVVYLTTSESLAGNLKDLVLLAACGTRLSSVVLHLHGGAGMRKLLRPERPVLLAINRIFLQRVGAVIVLGERLVDIFDGLTPHHRIRIVPNFAVEDVFASDHMIEHRFPKRFSREEPLRLLFLSNLLPGKGHDELVSAIQLLNEDERDCVKVDFAGGFQSDDERQRFEEKISALSNITYHGVVRGETKRTLLHNAHVLCLPTYYPYEGQPIAILEGYAAGCTVFTTDHSGIFDIFTPEVNGIALDKGSPESVRNAIRAALSSPETLIRTAQANSKLAREQYRAHDYAERLLGILRGVTSPNG